MNAPEHPPTLATTLATWVFLLHVNGHHSDDTELHAACEAVSTAEEEAAGNAAGEKLVHRVEALLTGESTTNVVSFARRLYGDRLGQDLGEGSRAERTHRIRQYQFSHSLPWLARVWERDDNGTVGPVWLVVERVTDQVTAMDPNPWNDIDETRHFPVSDFHVLWELDACTALHLI